MKRLPGDVAGQAGSQKDCCPGDFVDMTGPTQRDGISDTQRRPVWRQRHESLGEGEVGRDRVDPDLVRCKLERRSLGVVDHAGLRRRVRGIAGGRAHSFDRREIDDAAGQFVGHQPTCHPLCAQQHMAQIALVQGVPTVLARLQQRRGEHTAGIVDQNAYRPQLGGGLRQRGIHLLGVAHIGDDPQGTYRRRGISAALLVAFPDRYRGPERCQPGRNTPADTGAAAGDDGHLTGEKNVRRIDSHGFPP